MKLELNFYNPTGAANIIDLDSKDAYTEVAIFDDGASGDPALPLFAMMVQSCIP